MGAVDLRNKTKCQTVTFNGKTISLKDDVRYRLVTRLGAHSGFRSRIQAVRGP